MRTLKEINKIIYHCDKSLCGEPITETEFKELGINTPYSNHVPDSWADEVRILIPKIQEVIKGAAIIVQVKEKFGFLSVYYDYDHSNNDDTAVQDFKRVTEEAQKLEAETINILCSKGVYP